MEFECFGYRIEFCSALSVFEDIHLIVTPNWEIFTVNSVSFQICFGWFFIVDDSHSYGANLHRLTKKILKWGYKLVF